MTERRVREPADITVDAGIAVINHVLSSIEGHRKLREHEFGISVKESLISVRKKLIAGDFFSAEQQKAINNWSNGVQKWLNSPKDFQ